MAVVRVLSVLIKLLLLALHFVLAQLPIGRRRVSADTLTELLSMDEACHNLYLGERCVVYRSLLRTLWKQGKAHSTPSDPPSVHRDCRSCETPNIFSTHRQCTGCRMQRAYANGVVSSISLLRLPHLRLDVGRIPCRSTAPGVKCVRAIHPSAMAAASEHSDGPKNKLASSSSPYLKQHETNPVSMRSRTDWRRKPCCYRCLPRKAFCSLFNF